MSRRLGAVVAILAGLTGLGVLTAVTRAPADSAGWSAATPLPLSARLPSVHLGMDGMGEAGVLVGDAAGRVTFVLRRANGSLAAPQRLAAAGAGGEQLAMGADGAAVAVWAQAARRGPVRVMAAVRRPFSRFGRPRVLGVAPSLAAAQPAAAVSALGAVAVAFQRRDGAAVALWRPGTSWRRARSLGVPGNELALRYDARRVLHAAFVVPRGGAEPVVRTGLVDRRGRLRSVRTVGHGHDPAMTVTGDGSTVLAWRMGEHPAAIVTMVAAPGAPFVADRRLEVEDPASEPPVLAGGPRASVLLSWGVYDPPDADEPPVYANAVQRAPDGLWLSPQQLSPHGALSATPAGAIDAGGTVTVAYTRRIGGAEQALLVRTGPSVGTLGAEVELARTSTPADAGLDLVRPEAATAGTTTVLAWPDPAGRRVLLFVRTGG